MTDDVNARLDSIFSARTAKEVEATQRANEARQKETNSLQAFLKLQEDLIRPALEALAQNLQDRGQVCNVFDITDGENLGGRRQEAAIGICSGLMKPDTHLGENARQIEVSDDQTTPLLYS